MLCGAILLLKKKKRPCAAQWYGKVATVMFYVSVALIVVMDGFLHVEGVAFQVISYVLLGLTAAMMIYSAVKYAQIFLKILRSDDSQYDLSLTGRDPRQNGAGQTDKIVTKTLGPLPGEFPLFLRLLHILAMIAWLNRRLGRCEGLFPPWDTASRGSRPARH